MVSTNFNKTIKLFAVLALGLSTSNAIAQSRWSDINQRERTGGAQANGLWQGSNWLDQASRQSPRWRLGVSGDNTETGVRIREVGRGSAAARAQIEPGDAILAVGGYQVGMVDGRLYDLSEEINRRADGSGTVLLLIQDHRNYGLASVRVQLDRGQQSLTGTLVYRDRASLPSDAIVTVQIDNVTRPYYQVREGQTAFRPNASGDIPFQIVYDPNYINPQDRYQVRAFVTSRGKTILDSPQPLEVITQGNPTQVRLQMVSTGSNSLVSAGYPNFGNVDDQLIGLYRRYLRRDPAPIELAALRATPGIAGKMDSMPLELMAAQEYFDAAGNNNQVWMQKVFEEIVGKPPTQLELQQWTQRYAELGYSRTELLRQLWSQAKR